MIPPYLDHMRIPVGLIGTLISLGTAACALRRGCPSECCTNSERALVLVSIAILVMGATNYSLWFRDRQSQLCRRPSPERLCLCSAVTTLYMAFYVDSLAPDENRNHAMGYYVGSLAMGYSTGNLFGGLIADHWGYALTFQLGRVSFAGCRRCFWFLHRERRRCARRAR